MEHYYSTALSHFKSTELVTSAADLTAYASANGYSPPPAMSTPPAELSGKTCAKCGGPPKHRCTGCAEGVDCHGNHSPTYYCGKDCQEEHWQTAHKSDCKLANHRKKLFRAGAILQPVFEAIYRLIWYENVREAKWGNYDGQEKLLVYDGEVHTNKDARGFPDELLPDERAKRVLLAHVSGDLALATMSKMLGELLKGVCDESKIHEIGLLADAPLEVQPFASGEGSEPIHLTGNRAFHWLFGVTLANGESYAVDLCTSRFSLLPGAELLSCIAPLEEHARRLLVTDKDGMFRIGDMHEFGFHRRAMEEATLKGAQEGIAKPKVYGLDLLCLARKLALKHLEEANKHWRHAQSTTFSKALGLPAPKFAHVFCTIVWPIELMARKQREWKADPTTIMSTILSGTSDLDGMGL